MNFHTENNQTGCILFFYVIYRKSIHNTLWRAREQHFAGEQIVSGQFSNQLDLVAKDVDTGQVWDSVLSLMQSSTKPRVLSALAHQQQKTQLIVFQIIHQVLG